MARRTSLYQAPRSPLIQGRTRWERPLWESWLVGALVAAITAFLLWWFSGRVVLPGPAWIAVAVTLVVLAAAGSALARFWGWRLKWLGAALLGVFGAVIMWAFWYATYLDQAR